MTVYTPGVYVNEINTLTPSITNTSTAVPLFIGITKKQPNNYTQEAIFITNIFEFSEVFGGKYAPEFSYNHTTKDIIPDKQFYLYTSLEMYFNNGGAPCYIISEDIYDNIDHTTTLDFSKGINKIAALDAVTLVLVPDIHIQTNDNTGISSPIHYANVTSNLINVCAGLETPNKFVILDYHQPNSDRDTMRNAIVPSDINDLKYGALYYPWLLNSSDYTVSYGKLLISAPSGSLQEASLTTAISDINTLETIYGSFQTISSLNARLEDELGKSANKTHLTSLMDFLYDIINAVSDSNSLVDSNIELARTNLKQNTVFTENVKKLYWFRENLINADASSADLLLATTNLNYDDDWIDDTYNTNYSYSNYSTLIADASNLGYTPTVPNPATSGSPTNLEIITVVKSDLTSGQYVNLNAIFSGIARLFSTAQKRKEILEQQLFEDDSMYASAREAVNQYMKKVPSQGAIAGIYCKNDRDRGVWKSPANMAVQGIEKPLFLVSNTEQDELNVDNDNGKSINVIRKFSGRGSLVWGARTLAGNSNEWRYISVRRFFCFAEDAIQKALHQFIFESNNERTWVKMKGMLISFLAEQWRDGALVGSKMDDAFFVNIGRETTSETEINNGIINIQIGMAVAKPAEFIILNFAHKVSIS